MILVTGASGFIGLHLVRALAAAGHEVRTLVRSEDAAERVRAATPAGAVDIVLGTMSDGESLRRAAKGCELVHHLAGPYKGSPAELYAAHAEGTANLLAALDAGTRVVLLSSMSVYGWDRPWPADHNTPPRPTSAYGLAKLAAEQQVLAWPEGDAVVARTTIVYGPGDVNGMVPRVVRLLQKGVRWFPGSGRNRIHLLHVDDLVAGLPMLNERGSGVFVFGGPEAVPLERIVTLLAEGAGLRPPRFGLPAPALLPVAAGVEGTWRALHLPGEPPLTRHSVEVATQDRAFSWARAEEELGWHPTVALEVGLPAVGAELAGGGDGRDAVASASARPDSPLPSWYGFNWRAYLEDEDEGLGTVYERFALARVLESAVERTGATSVLHAPSFGMLGVPGLDAIFLARRGIRVGLLDFDKERFDYTRSLWSEFGLTPETHVVPGPDPATWPDQLPAEYDLVFSFAALWWFDDPWAVLAAQARWARKGLLVCVPNRNVFMKMRSLLWHRSLFDDLNEEALDPTAIARAARAQGLTPVGEGLFDIPPFPDTSVPLANVLRLALGSRGKGDADAQQGGTWSWSILPYLRGQDPGLEERVERFVPFERHLPSAVAPHLAHHRYDLFVPDGAVAPEDSRAAARPGVSG
ncbi:MAG TPA: NAD-dependent epimerase/dehydratase family protein [Acidimicrobiales bacterium]|nr:NAD-dependent epimerase/dehydratase family protein [Acidimicrobiales bacterium]